jgi:autotransporter-associated beta strand protein
VRAAVKTPKSNTAMLHQSPVMNRSVRPSIISHILASIAGIMLFGEAQAAETTISYIDGQDRMDPIVLDEATAPTLLDVPTAAAATQSGIISESGGSFGITKVGEGSLTLTGANTYTGPTAIGSETAAGGTLIVGAGGTLGDGTSALFLGGADTVNTGNLDLTGNSATVGSLTVSTNDFAANTVTIGAGHTLTVNGDVTIGGLMNTATRTTLFAATGAGALVIGTSGGTLNVVNFSANDGAADTDATMDVSGLASFTADYGSTGVINVGSSANVDSANNRAPFGTLVLGANNTLTAGELNVGVNANNGSSANRSAGTVLLGTTNVINVDAITVGAGKAVEANPMGGRMLFNEGLTNPEVTLRGSDGTSRVASLIVYDGSLYTASSNHSGPIGTVDFTGGTVNAMIENLTVTIGKAAANTAPSTGMLSFDAGIIDATTATIAVRGTTTTGAGSVTTGTLNVNGTANLVVGAGGIILGDTSQGVGDAAITGNLNIDGGTVTMGGDIRRGPHNDVGSPGIANVTLTAGMLDMGNHNLGTTDGPITTLEITAGTLQNVGEIHVLTLQKLGGGDVTLDATALTGNVEVQAGTLILVSDILSATTDVSLVDGAKLALNFVGTDAVNQLFFNGVPQLTGTWGAAGSGADHIDNDFFSGIGTLTVLVPEPSVVALALVGMGFLLYRRRRVARG